MNTVQTMNDTFSLVRNEINSYLLEICDGDGIDMSFEDRVKLLGKVVALHEIDKRIKAKSEYFLEGLDQFIEG